ncbi:hypothetical protein BLNAU_11319 [Blattamonas nauphoetae]|uniref:Uncharacterized protein n=1 Tax=Blattamonas nauphoetae TaxID=2049346 RepID=A0ABQ9XQR3_9EUKA|nr:hypothetical protein BLNAU_11319 [Blattamonas nauphoetae]
MSNKDNNPLVMTLYVSKQPSLRREFCSPIESVFREFTPTYTTYLDSFESHLSSALTLTGRQKISFLQQQISMFLLVSTTRAIKNLLLTTDTIPQIRLARKSETSFSMKANTQRFFRLDFTPQQEGEFTMIINAKFEEQMTQQPQMPQLSTEMKGLEILDCPLDKSDHDISASFPTAGVIEHIERQRSQRPGFGVLSIFFSNGPVVDQLCRTGYLTVFGSTFRVRTVTRPRPPNARMDNMPPSIQYSSSVKISFNIENPLSIQSKVVRHGNTFYVHSSFTNTSTFPLNIHKIQLNSLTQNTIICEDDLPLHRSPSYSLATQQVDLSLKRLHLTPLQTGPKVVVLAPDTVPVVPHPSQNLPVSPGRKVSFSSMPTPPMSSSNSPSSKPMLQFAAPPDAKTVNFPSILEPNDICTHTFILRTTQPGQVPPPLSLIVRIRMTMGETIVYKHRVDHTLAPSPVVSRSQPLFSIVISRRPHSIVAEQPFVVTLDITSNIATTPLTVTFHSSEDRGIFHTGQMVLDLPSLPANTPHSVQASYVSTVTGLVALPAITVADQNGTSSLIKDAGSVLVEMGEEDTASDIEPDTESESESIELMESTGDVGEVPIEHDEIEQAAEEAEEEDEEVEEEANEQTPLPSPLLSPSQSSIQFELISDTPIQLDLNTSMMVAKPEEASTDPTTASGAPSPTN